jgi:histidinol-phosphate aminotransferase
MGLLDHYKQFEEMDPEEVSAQLRAEADERRRKALATVDKLDLSATTWPEYPPPSVVGAITFTARRGLHNYMEPAGELRAEIAHRHGLPAERIVLGDGASQLLVSAAQNLMGDGDELITPWPSYQLYPVMAHEAGGDVVTVTSHSVDAILAAVTKKTRLIAICNPNDPSGELISVDDLSELLDKLPDRVAVLLDEALRDFVSSEAVDATIGLCERHPRLLIFRSFSKAWGLAGLRCGYAIGGPGAEALLSAIGPPLGIGELTQAGVLEALRTISPIIAERTATVAEQRLRLRSELAALPLELGPQSEANLLWLASEKLDGAELAARLAKAGVIVRAGGTLGDAARIRVAIQDAAASDRLLRALSGAL